MMDGSQLVDNSRTSESPTLCSLRGITKKFPSVLANDGVNLDIYPGEVHALLGENGAGKSTLVKILYGFYQQDSGEIEIKGQPVDIRSPFDARNLRIGMVFQDLTLIPAMSVIENIALFLPTLGAIPDLQELAADVHQLSERYRLEVDLWAPVWQLSVGEQQKIEVLKLLLAKAQIFIFGEPTRVLAPHEIEGLFNVFEQLKKDDFAIIFITHKLREVLKIADRITVLRKGQVAGSLKIEGADENSLISLMFDSPPPVERRPNLQSIPAENQALLDLKNISTKSPSAATELKNISLSIYPGEILGVAGVSGNGQKELGDVILGLERSVAGSIHLSGANSTKWSATRVRQSGVAFIPENPLVMAAIPTFTVAENMALGNPRKYARQFGLSMAWAAVRQDMEDSFNRFGFEGPNPDVQTRTLSGGNLQRLIIARELAREPILIIALYPTRGLDVMSAIGARNLLLSARDEGKGILLISEDLSELLSLSDRLIVLFQGSIAGEFRPAEVSMTEIGHLMTGSRKGYDE